MFTLGIKYSMRDSNLRR